MPNRLDHQWIMDYASGAGPEALSVLVDAAAELNPGIDEQVRLAESIGAALVRESLWDPVLYPEFDLDQVNDIISSPADPVYPRALNRLGFTSDRDHWRSRLGGVEGRKINRLCSKQVDARLFRIQPGHKIPHHDHGGDELTLVLQGGFSDEFGSYHRGDVCVGQAGKPHNPIGLEGEACICFAVSLGGYRFRNPIMAVAARMLK